jgi:hypothetical protein
MGTYFPTSKPVIEKRYDKPLLQNPTRHGDSWSTYPSKVRAIRPTIHTTLSLTLLVLSVRPTVLHVETYLIVSSLLLVDSWAPLGYGVV